MKTASRWLIISVLWTYFTWVSSNALALDTNCDKCHASYKAVVTKDTQDQVSEDCTHCHAAVHAGNTGRAGSSPYVYHNTGTDLAGGNFYYVGLHGNRHGHNVDGFTDIGPDTINAPGLNDPSLNFTSGRLKCAGKYGCHGDRTKISPREAMKRVHHAYDPAKPSDGKTVATSYRFLLGVTGREMNEDGYKWEYKTASDKHNEYQGADNWRDSKSISYLCGQCHGNDALGSSTDNFHGAPGTGGKGSWLRHPTDIPIPDGEFSGYTEYNPIVPVARLDLNRVTNPSEVNVSSGNEVVMCLSCHRAHGSPYPSILRFAYDANMSSSGSCRTCHRNH